MANMDSLGPEALLHASRECKFRLVRLLIDGGTSENIRNENQETPLILACKSESEEKEKVIEFLIRKRVKVNLQDVHGKTALMYACLTNSSDNIIRMLVNSKANPWLVDESNTTAFDYAINAGNIGTVKLMIQACREGKILTKPGSFNIEMKRLEDRLDQMPEIRKWSWPLMGPRNSTKSGKEKIGANNSNLLAVNEVDEATENPTRERRRKRSICHFDPIDLDKEEELEETESLAKASSRKSSLNTAGCSAFEDEKISLLFSDSDNSSFDRLSTSFTSLEKLLRIHDSITSSVESNDSLNAKTSQSAVVVSLKKDSMLKTDSEALDKSEGIEEMQKDNLKFEKLNQSETVLIKCHKNKYDSSFECNNKSNESCARHESEVSCKNCIIQEGVKDKLMQQARAFPYGTPQTTVSPRVRRKTVGTSAPSRKDDVSKDWERKKSGEETEGTRRLTVGTMDMKSERRRSPNLLDEDHNYRPSPLPTNIISSGSQNSITVELNFCELSPEVRLHRKKIRSPEVDFPLHKDSTEIELNRKRDNTSIQHSPKSEVKPNTFPPLNLPLISPPENMESKENEKKGTKTQNNPQAEKTTIRRTLSDSMRHEKKPASAVGAGQRCQGNDTDEFSRLEENNACVHDSTDDATLLVTRERSASFTPLSTNEFSTPPQERKTYLSSNTNACCDIVTMATSSTGEALRSRNSRNKLSSDLPDLVLHTPRSRVRTPTNLDPFSFTPELQLTDPIYTRLPRSAPTSPENPIAVNQTLSTGSHSGVKSTNSKNHLPEVVSGTTGSPKGFVRAKFLPPLNIPRKSQDPPEDGYFSCSPSPMDLESPSRSKDSKSKYSFKPSSPRLRNLPVRNMLP